MASISATPSSIDIMKISSYSNGSPATTATNSTNNLEPLIATPTASDRLDRICDSKDCMKLTPVNLQCLASPIRQSRMAMEDYNTHQSLLPGDVYKENFSLISRQLEKLLENLDVIFKNIGYSNSEIISKEKMVFNTLSDSINEFFAEAEKDMKILTEENESSQEILNRILEIIHDPNGVQSIPDLYVRNAILVPQSKNVPGSPRKPLSLLSKQKLLGSAKKYVFDAYVPRLMKFLHSCIQLMSVFEAVKEPLPNLPIANVTYFVPDLEVSRRLRDSLKQCHSDVDLISKFVKDSKQELLFNGKFNDISSEMTQKIYQSAALYQDDYNSKLKELTSTVKALEDLLKELNIDMKNDLDSKTAEIMISYSGAKSNSQGNQYLPVNQQIRVQLQDTLKKYQETHKARSETKEKLMNKCQNLWQKLKVPANYVESILLQTAGLSLDSIKKLSKELEKLESMKKRIIKTLVSESWQKIEDLWKILQFEDQEKSSFLNTFDTLRRSSASLQDDEKLLEVCEKEIKCLEEKLAVYTPVLKLIKEFKQLQADKASLDESSKDSSRLLLRNSHKILLQEEKTRKRITRHFPRVIQELKEGLGKIHELFGKPVFLGGEKLIDLVIQQEEEIISKYPRSRLNLGTRRSSRSQLKSSPKKVEKPQSAVKKSKCNDSLREIFVANLSAVHQTPLTKISSANYDDKFTAATPRDASRCSSMLKTSRFSSPPRTLRKLLPPRVITRQETSKIPEVKLKRAESSNLQSSPLGFPKSLAMKRELVRPTRLFPVSPSRINQRNSQIPVLHKSASIATEMISEISDKENIVDSTPRLQRGPIKEGLSLSSPYREPENSVYRISMSPDGKCQLNVKQGEMDSALDETSIMDAENDKDFQAWKNEQLLKINEHSKDIL